MIQVIGQATQSNGGSPSWTLTGVCKSASRTADGTYTVTIDYLGALGIDSKDKLTILVSAERGNLGTERYILDWTSTNTFRVRNYTARNNQTLGDCMLTITVLADVNPLRLGFGGNTLIFPQYKFFDVTTDGGYIVASNTAGYPGELNVLTGVPATDAYKCSGFGITGAALTGNEFKYENRNVSAEALFEHSRDLTLVPNEHATLSADKMSGFSGDVVTVDATTDEGWYFTGLNLTGATATGNQFMFVGENVTAEGLYTDEGYPITYIVETGGSLTGDQIYIPGSTGITLETSYDPYYRFSGYEVTGGTITDNVLVAEGPCTAKAVYKVNYFTATGNFNFATGAAWAGVASWSRNCDGIIRARTGSLPSEWGANGSNFNPSDASSYKINWNTTLYFQSNNLNKGSKAMTGYNRIYCGTTNVKTTTCTIAGSRTGNYAKANTNNNGNSTIQGHPYMNAAIGSTTSRVQMNCNSCSPNGWTATGIAP